MGDILWAGVAIGGPIVIAAAVVYGLLTHSQPRPRNPASSDGTIANIVQLSDKQDDQGA